VFALVLLTLFSELLLFLAVGFLAFFLAFREIELDSESSEEELDEESLVLEERRR